MGSILNPLAAVDLQLRRDTLFLSRHYQGHGIQHQIHRLLCSGLVGHDSAQGNNCRKSHSRSFSICKRWITHACSAIISLGTVFFLGRPLRRRGIPGANFACLRLYRLIQFLICTLLSPNRPSISCRAAPASHITRISSIYWICVFSLRHANTPCIGLFSYTGGILSIVHFSRFAAGAKLYEVNNPGLCGQHKSPLG